MVCLQKAINFRLHCCVVYDGIVLKDKEKSNVFGAVGELGEEALVAAPIGNYVAGNFQTAFFVGAVH
jgi:hypothetical protein